MENNALRNTVMSANTHSIWKDPSEEASLDLVVLRVCEVLMPGRYQEQERGGCLDLFSAASLEVEVTFLCPFFSKHLQRCCLIL